MEDMDLKEDIWEMKHWEDPIMVMLGSWIIGFGLFLLILLISLFQPSSDGSAHWTVVDTVIATVAITVAVVGTVWAFVMAPTVEKRRKARS